jgi:ribosome-associated toxin RatA of RatAB toxin-antitoxin module
MIKHHRLINADYPIDLLFHIAQDVENYRAFLPHCVGARILDRTLPKWRVENLFRWGPARYKFITHADVHPKESIHIQSDPSEKVQLDILWKFTSCGEHRTEVIFEISFATQIPILEKLVASLIEQMAQETEQAFLNRAAVLRND